MDHPRDKKCCEKFEVGHKYSSWEMEGVRNKICVACEGPTEHLMPDATVRLCEEGRKKAAWYLPPTFSQRISLER